MGENVTHFSHPLHPLGKALAVPESFTCDACMMEASGSGHMYWCESCDVKLHCLCATCPQTLAFFLHPEHPIVLVNLKGHIGSAGFVTCDVCRGGVQGMSYRCAACDFDVHPHCALLPPTVRDEVHPDHILTFMESKRRPCAQCGIQCTHARYRCDLCDVDFHPKCLQRAATTA